MESHPDYRQSSIITLFSRLIEFGNEWLTLSNWIFKSSQNIFRKLEKMMTVITLICVGLLFTIHLFSYWLAIVISILLIQRIIEFLVVYSRNFIFNRGRIFSDFQDPGRRGQWLIIMFSFNILQVIFIFAIWYRVISVFNPSAFSQSLSILDSLYFSIITFLTVGYGDIIPLADFPKILVMLQSILTFYIIVIVINGLISIHFRKR